MEGSESVRVNFTRPLALFPLDVVLLPQQPMPLHIFEGRYRQMVDRALDGSGQFAIATIDRDRGVDELGQPRIKPVVCVGQIVSHERMPDGRFSIVLHGLCRARVVREIPANEETLYRSAEVEPLGHEGAELESPTDSMDRLRGWVDEELERGALSRLRIAEHVLAYVRNDLIPTPVLLDVVGFTLMTGQRTRYRMLSEPSPEKRTRLLWTELSRLSGTIEAALDQHPEAWPKGQSWN